MSEKRAVSLAHHAHVFPGSMKADGTIDHLLKHLDECNIESAVCFAPFQPQAGAAGIEPNPWLAKELAGHSRLHGFGTIDFRRGDARQQVKQIQDLGLKGIKIHPASQKIGLLSPVAMEIYAAAEERDVFVSFHTGIHHHRLRDARVVDWDEICFNFPKLRFSMEHVGGWSYFHDALAVMTNNTPPPWVDGTCKVFAGLTSIFSPGQLPFWFCSLERLQELIGQVGINQLIFGLDFPYNDAAATKRGIETIHDLDLSDEEEALVLGGNLARELKIAK